MKLTSADAARLFHEGSIVFSEVEAAGMRIDVPRLRQTIGKVGERIKGLGAVLMTDPVWQLWRKRFGGKASLGSGHQLGQILYEDMGFKPIGWTSGGKGSEEERKKKSKPSLTEESLSAIAEELPFASKYVELEKLKKLHSTYLEGVLRETGEDGLLHPVFNLHLVKSYRSSSDSPNFQNIPIRDKEIAKLIRTCFIPREGHVLVEVDYGALEFRIAASFWRDEAMIRYASDPDLDIHRDMAAECYLLPVDSVPSACRFFAKNQFVFPELYGSWWKNCARNLWSVIDQAELKTVDGVGLKEHLAFNGIERFQEFERHIEGVEEEFNAKFPTWADRKDKWWSRYNKRGWFDLMTGFRISGVYSRNQLMNIPIQGPAFHCLLYSLVLFNRWLKREGMRSMIVGQIHDSIVLDVHRDELDEVLMRAKRIMTEDVRKAWSWIITPLVIECKVGEDNWWEMKEITL